jgi:hypothetical protein
MNVLFFIRHQGYVRNFESTLRMLAERGHRVHLALSLRQASATFLAASEGLAQLESRYPPITSSLAPPSARTRWARLALALRFSLDWLRYLGPAFRDAEKLRGRTLRHVPLALRRLMRLPGMRRPLPARAMIAMLRAFDRAVPVREVDLRFIAEHEPDLVLVTPLVDGGIQPGYLRAAHRLGIPAGLCVASWDNLTSKGLIQGEPDFVTLWNETQRREAVELHGLDPGVVFPTGAQAYDHWFTWRPSTTREEFCAPLGLDPGQPFLLYMCSSGFIAGTSEVPFVTRWLGELRARPGLERVGVLVRPHPAHAEIWRGVQLPGPQAAVWKVDGTEPVTADRKNEFFDSMYHSAGVVGVNTSALVESAIVGKPVFTLLAPEFEQTQAGTLHFEMIAGAEGMLDVAETMDEHAAHLAAALADPSYGEERRWTFLRAFVRPHGVDEPATDRLVGVLEEQAARPKQALSDPLGRRLLRLLLVPATFLKWHSAPVAAGNRKRRRRALEKLRGRAQRRVAEAILELRSMAKAVRRVVTRLRKRRFHVHTYRWLKRVVGTPVRRVRKRLRVAFHKPGPARSPEPPRDELPALLRERGLVGRGAEIGIRAAKYSASLLEHWPGTLIAVDPSLEEKQDARHAEARRRLARHGTRAELWRTPSLDAAQRVPDASLDFVYLHPQKSPRALAADVEAWLPKIRPGGILAGRDALGAKDAVEEALADRGLRVDGTQVSGAWLVEIPLDTSREAGKAASLRAGAGADS